MKIKSVFTIKHLLVTLTLAGLILAACQSSPSPEVVKVVDQVEGEALVESNAEPLEAPLQEAGEQPSGEPQAGAETDLLAYPSASQRMVIKDAKIDLLVSDTSRAVAQVTGLAAAKGGYIIDSRSWYEGEHQYAEIKLGVPVGEFENVLNTLRDAGLQVLDETVSGQDVSEAYNDLQARLTNLEATAERVRSFLDDAQTIEDALKINATLAELEGQIEEVKGKMRFYEGRSAFSTVTVILRPLIPTPTPVAPRPAPKWNPGKTFTEAAAVMTKNMQNFIDSLIWVVVVFWPLVLVVILVVGWLVYRRKRRETKDEVDIASD